MENWLLKKRNIWPSQIAQQFNLPHLISEIMSRRELYSMDEIEKYICNDPSMLHSPFLLKDMDIAVQIILKKIKQKKKILFALDYDVDGIISGAIAQIGFQKLGMLCECIFPHRVIDGYGINKRMVQYAIDNDISCIVTFDNGIAAFEPILFAKEHNIDVIVTDHHEIPIVLDGEQPIEHLVAADAIVNPKQSACGYPFRGICGAMIAYKLLSATNESLGFSKENIAEVFPLVSIATICDVMELVDENRIIVHSGLKELPETPNLGLKALFRQLNILKSPTVYDIGFKIGPCFNSSGRLASAQLAFNLLVTEDKAEAEEFSRELISLNEERKKLTQDATARAVDMVEHSLLFEDQIIVILLEGVHESLAGIVAGRIKEKYGRPTLVFTKTDGYYKGSARSVDNVNIFEILSKFKSYFYRFGGHSAAAGLSVYEEQFADFCEELKHYANSLDLSESATYFVDAILPLNELNLSFARDLEIFEPTGKGNTSLLFASTDLSLRGLSLRGKESSVLKIDFFSNGAKRSFVSFDFEPILSVVKNKMSLPEEYDIIGSLPRTEHEILFDIIYKVNINRYMDNEYLNLEIISIR